MMRSILLTMGFALAANTALAQDEIEVPKLLPVQGHILDSNDQGLEGELSIRFALYSGAIGGEPLYQETRPVEFKDGHFMAYIGDGGQLDLSIFWKHSAVYLGMTVADDTEMRPRILMASASYAAYTKYASDSAKLAGRNFEEFALKSDVTFTATNGLSLNGTSIGLDRSTVEQWSRAACFDTEQELTAQLDDNYMSSAYTPDWSTLTGMPPSFADNVDNDTVYSGGTGINLDGTSFNLDQSTVENWAKNAAIDTEAEMTVLLDDNYLSQSYRPDWTDIRNIPAGFYDGVDNQTNYNGGNGINVVGQTISVNPASISNIMAQNNFVKTSTLTACVTGQVLQRSANGWVCATFNNSNPGGNTGGGGGGGCYTIYGADGTLNCANNFQNVFYGWAYQLLQSVGHGGPICGSESTWYSSGGANALNVNSGVRMRCMTCCG
ncbi:MAG: hypothetical protein VYC39_08980 [Myxococcota bacterium]|nr:hypothetical protein [Myxococcota bacterium]